MKKEDIQIDKVYIANVGGKRTTIRIESESLYGGWIGRNLSNNKRITIKDAKRFMKEVNEKEN